MGGGGEADFFPLDSFCDRLGDFFLEFVEADVFGTEPRVDVDALELDMVGPLTGSLELWQTKKKNMG